MKVIRHIHPIGQGAFYTERFVDDNNTTLANVVYDCGCGVILSKQSEKLITSSFIGSDKIDILCISHFDADHVNGISTLLDNGISIKYVVMPFLAPEEIKFLLAFYEKIEPAYQDIRTLINTPDYYFGEETIIIKIKPINEIYSDDNNYADISLDNWAENQLTKENGCFCINSFSRIKFLNNWIYIPFNFASDERRDKLFQLLKNKNVVLNNDIDSLVKYNSSELKKIYEKIEGKANGNSLILYSGLDSNNIVIMNSYLQDNMSLILSRYLLNNISIECSYHTSGCLYLGDSNLNDLDSNNRNVVYYLKSHKRISKYLIHLGIIQIPHHGSLKSYSNDLMSFSECKNFFLSCGNNNKYGHPSDYVIEELVNNNSIVSCVTESKNSSLIQVIKFKDLN